MRKLPVFYGWIVVAVSFVSMAIGVNAPTSLVVVLSADPSQPFIFSVLGVAAAPASFASTARPTAISD